MVGRDFSLTSDFLHLTTISSSEDLFELTREKFIPVIFFLFVFLVFEFFDCALILFNSFSSLVQEIR